MALVPAHSPLNQVSRVGSVITAASFLPLSRIHSAVWHFCVSGCMSVV